MCCGDGGWHESCYIFNMSGHIKYLWVGGGRHCGWQGQQCRRPLTHLWSDMRHVESINIFHVNHHLHSMSRRSWRKFQPKLKKTSTDVIHPNVSDLPGHLLRIVFAVHDVVNVNTHVLNVVRLVESINNFHVNHHYHSILHPGKLQLMWYIPATSLVFSSLLLLPTTKPHEQKIGKWDIHEKDFQWTS